MVPASLTRSVSQRTSHETGLARDREWKPANVPFAKQAELRALVVWGALLGGLGVVLLLGHVWVRLKVMEAGYRLSATRQLVERLEQEGRELQVRAAAADSTDRVADLAHRRLGMRPPQRGEEVGVP